MIAQPVARVRRLFLIVLFSIVSAACAGAPEKPRAEKPRASVGERAANVALQQVGVPYRYGGNSPRGFDCSGLVHYSYASVGKSIPRTTSAQWASLVPVGRAELRAGDLLFFRIAGKMSHVGMYIGAGRFVHAPSTGRSVSIETLRSDFYHDAFIRAGRPR